VAGVSVLATSREHLDVDGEQVVRLGPLSAEAGEAAVRLFVERFAAVQPDVDLDGDDLDRIAGVCRRLDGMPLAIELAAARARSMTIAEIEDGLDDRFSLLAGGGGASCGGTRRCGRPSSGRSTCCPPTRSRSWLGCRCTWTGSTTTARLRCRAEPGPGR
jgi:predicted ATPase